MGAAIMYAAIHLNSGIPAANLPPSTHGRITGAAPNKPAAIGMVITAITPTENLASRVKLAPDRADSAIRGIMTCEMIMTKLRSRSRSRVTAA